MKVAAGRLLSLGLATVLLAAAVESSRSESGSPLLPRPSRQRAGPIGPIWPDLPPPPPGRGPTTTDADWWSGFGLPMVDGWITSVAEFEGSIVIGGRFSQAGGVPANNVAAWDGAGWRALGPGMDGDVHCLAVHDGELVAGGHYLNAGGARSVSIARWDGLRWQALGSGVAKFRRDRGTVNALLSHHGQLYVAGDFDSAGGVPARGVARWDGDSWYPLAGGLNRAAHALGTFRDTLYVGGAFDTAGVVPASRVARWDGGAWSALGAGVGGAGLPAGYPIVRTMTGFHDRLIVAGAFEHAGGHPAANIAAWNGAAWDSLQGGLADDYGPLGAHVFALEVHRDTLFAGGYFSRAGSGYGHNLAAWDGSSWSKVSDWHDGQVIGLLSSRNELFVAGRVSAFRSHPDCALVGTEIARWNGSEWFGLETWTDSMHGLAGRFSGGPRVRALASHRGVLWAVGSFDFFGDPPGWSNCFDARDVLNWSGTRWAPALAPPFDPTTLQVEGDTLYALTRYPAAVGAPTIAGFDGRQWFALDTLSLSVRSLCRFGGQLYAGGHALGYWGAPRPGGVYRWTGDRWDEVGVVGDHHGGTQGGINGMTVHDGRLVVVGTFDSIGGRPLRNIAAWNGAEWTTIDPRGHGNRFDIPLSAVVVHQGRLSVALENGFGASAVQEWTGEGWRSLGTGHIGRPRGLASVRGNLFAFGAVAEAGDPRFTGLLRWDGEEWHTLGSGVNGEVDALVEHDGRLFLGGGFTMAGGKSSFAIARWDGPYGRGGGIVRESVMTSPNPFRDRMTLSFEVRNPGRATLSVFDITGRKVAVLLDGNVRPGRVEATWNPGAGTTVRVAPGVYFVQLRHSDGTLASKRIVRL